MKKLRILSLVLATSLTMAFAGCTSNNVEKKETQETADSKVEKSPEKNDDNSTESPSSDQSMKVAAVLGVGGLGDQSFNDLAYEGLERAKQELGVEFDYVEPKQISDFELYLREMAAEQSYGVIISIGFDQADALTKVAAEFPDQKFGYIDGVVELPNVISYVLAEEQGSFLVGALAGLMKKEASLNLNDKNTLGFIGALDIPLINKFYAGFEAGARYVNPDIQVRGDYVGNFDDITTTKEIANTMYNAGADIIYHAAGGAGLGMFQSAKDNNYYAIGVNSNQNNIDPQHIVASMLKRVDTVTYEIIKAAKDDQFEGGKTIELGLEQDGVGYSVEGSEVALPAAISEKIESIKADIVSGKIVVPLEKEAVDTFLKENSQ